MRTCRGWNCARGFALAIGLALSGAQVATADETAPPAAPSRPPAATPEVASYDVGLMLGSQLEHNGLAPLVSLDALIRGLRDAVGGRAATADERDAALQFMRSARDALVERNHAAAREFLDKNAKLPDVVTTPSGLQYRVLVAGDPNGKPPGPQDEVTVRYRASLADGTEFDRSESHDRPASFRVNSVLKGWQQALLAMKPGAMWRLFVPPELGYGVNSPPAVPPGALVVYELELLQVAPPPNPLSKHHQAGSAKPTEAPPAAPH
jgi:FKBP-type peptidyl-prolyl cis-trans isomerase FklB